MYSAGDVDIYRFLWFENSEEDTLETNCCLTRVKCFRLVDDLWSLHGAVDVTIDRTSRCQKRSQYSSYPNLFDRYKIPCLKRNRNKRNLSIEEIGKIWKFCRELKLVEARW